MDARHGLRVMFLCANNRVEAHGIVGCSLSNTNDAVELYFLLATFHPQTVMLNMKQTFRVE